MTGVMFDASGTLIRVEDTAAWLDAGLAELGLELDDEQHTALVARLDALGALPGTPAPASVPEPLVEAWALRELDQEAHRIAHTGLALAARLPDERLAQVLYDRHMRPEAWWPYPDALPTLEELRRRGVPVAVVSNIAWDLRPVFRRHGLDEFIDVYVFSFERSAQKPDPGLFRTALAELGRAPEQVLMVGDDVSTDGGAVAVGCAFHHVAHRPVDERPDALHAVLGLVSAAS
ncbi:HAD-IA family hydrolase [Streptomyces sp. NPDC059894]|uniref:HAD-IA family hydrolase n=1 Tax=unclassified Streptomyces TaxID=2593676 RepID=UPI003648EC17